MPRAREKPSGVSAHPLAPKPLGKAHVSARWALAALVLALAFLGAVGAHARPRQLAQWEAEFARIAAQTDGRLGVCASLDGEEASHLPDQAFSLQSVMKLVVAACALDAVDRGRMGLREAVTMGQADLSLNVQPLAEAIRAYGAFTTTWEDLVARAVVDSDSAATDFLMAKVGGPFGLKSFLLARGLHPALRVDRDERHLQTETTGLAWQPHFVVPGSLAQARARLTPAQRDAAFQAYLKDPRDTASPRAMTRFLSLLAHRKLLKPATCDLLVGMMARTHTFPDRLAAGLAPGWRLAHKTGTSDTWRGVNAATNDVGLLTAPDGRTVALSVFVAGSRQSLQSRAARVAACARAVVSHWP